MGGGGGFRTSDPLKNLISKINHRREQFWVAVSIFYAAVLLDLYSFLEFHSSIRTQSRAALFKGVWGPIGKFELKRFTFAQNIDHLTVENCRHGEELFENYLILFKII